MKAKKKKTADKRVKKGSGITAREINELNPHNWDPIFEADDRMKAELGREPDYFDWIAFGPLKWAEKVLKVTQAEKLKPDSPGDFAQRMIEAGDKARLAINKGDVAKAAYHAFNLGELVEAVRIKEIWEKPALGGLASLKGASKGGHARAAEARSDGELDSEDWQKRAERMWEKEPNLLAQGKEHTAKKIHEELKSERREYERKGLKSRRVPAVSTIRQSIKKS